ncbi:MAG: M23 family metallopeptidase [Thermodesulfobacteriota bacterium]
MKKKVWIAISLFIAICLAAGLWIWIVKFEQEKPTIKISPDQSYLGQKLDLQISDEKSGVAEVRVEALQKGNTVILWQEKIPKGTNKLEKTISLRPLPAGLKDGETELKVFARDHSWNWGNPVTVTKKFVVDTHPPQINVLGGIHYINQGGTGCITYQTSEETPISGVQVGEKLFPGYLREKNHYLVFFTLGYEQVKELAIYAVAEDQAGNKGKVSLRLIPKAKKFKADKIQLTDSFLKSIVPYFTERNPNLRGSLIDIFLAINRQQREADHQEIRKICQETSSQPLWSGAFLRLPNSKPMALFAEQRSYWYNGQEVDQQVHLGIDLASLAQSPIPAANNGRVVFAGPLGIYGNTVIIDHGCGLFSMYAHLSSIKTEIKKEVQKGDLIGHTGSTGLAGGDHLHFSMLIHGVFVNPIEWWDDHWIRDNVEKKMELIR